MVDMKLVLAFTIIRLSAAVIAEPIPSVSHNYQLRMLLTYLSPRDRSTDKEAG